MPDKNNFNCTELRIKELSNMYSYENIKHLLDRNMEEIPMFSRYVFANSQFDIIYVQS